MKFLIIMSTLLAIAAAQYGYPYGFGAPQDEEYAASLAGAPVGVYGKKHYGGPGGYGGYGDSEVSGASLGGAKVGLYGKEHGQQRPVSPQVYPGYKSLVSVPYPKPAYSKYIGRKSYPRGYPRKYY